MRNLWFKLKGWIARRTLYMAIAPWVLPVVGGIIVSTNLDGRWWLETPFWVGVAFIALGSIPLGIRDSWVEGEQKERDERNAKELKTRHLLAEKLESIVLPAALQGEAVEDHVREVLQDVLDSLVSEVYSDVYDARAVFFRPGKMGEMNCAFPAFTNRKSVRKPSTHLEDSSPYEGISKLFDGEMETYYENKVLGRNYKGFASAAVWQNGLAIGVLTLDTPGDYIFDQQDAQNLLSIASFFTAILTAQSQRLNTSVSSGEVKFEEF